ncbi:MAG: hypothetical protein J6N76_03125, partial [Lachnospiraceae bacterium]|nr:hypothetical protein [Lachnospiraceae bacterium]
MDELRKKREAFEFGSSSKMASELFKDMQDQANDQMQRFREADELSLQNKDLSIDENGLSDIDTEATKLNKENILKSDILKAKTATETLRNNFAGYSQVEQEQEDNLYIQAPELQEMQSQHIEYRERVVKRTLKPDKVVKEKIEKEVTDKDKQLETKAEMRNMVSEAAAKVKDERIKARANVDIDRKKKMDYNTFNQLSDFSSYMTEEDFRGLTTIYGEGVAFEKKYDVTNPESVEQRNKAREDNLYPAMDRLTDVIMNIDTKKLDVSFDKSISENAEELEKMSAAVKSYKDLLAKNPDYMDKRFSEEANGVSFGSQIMKKVEMLSAISNYYRIRKLVIEDDLYASIANEEISMEEEPGDDVKTKNLKKNMRLSFYAGLHLQQVAADADIEPPIFLTKDKDSEILKGRRMSESMEKLNQLDPEMSETEKYKLYLEELRRQDHVITHTEREQLLIAPKEEYNLLSIAPEKQRSTPNCGPNAKSLFTNKDASKNSYIDIIKDANKTSLYERYLEMEKTKANGSWGSAPQFDGGSEDYLSKLAISDNWNRTHMAFSTEYSYRQTDDEVMEMLDLLSIQKDKAAWDEIKKDPEKVAYYESAYKEMAMKLFEQI